MNMRDEMVHLIMFHPVHMLHSATLQDTVPVFAKRDWGKPQKHVMIVYSWNDMWTWCF
jgi:hypothetical protein